MVSTRLTVLPARPQRAHRAEDPEHAARARHLDCQGYDRCLALAAGRGWRSFHCRACPAYAPQPASARRREMLGLLALLAESDVVGAAEVTPAPPPAPPASSRRLFLLDADDTGATSTPCPPQGRGAGLITSSLPSQATSTRPPSRVAGTARPSQVTATPAV
jgi:hypothetical protein